jgi:nitroreductase
MDAIEMLLTRASNGKLGEPAPDDHSVRLALEAALRAPDHGMLRPWRIKLIRGTARERLGQVLRVALLRRKPNASVEELDREQKKPLRAPLIIVVSAHLREHPKAPAVEQLLSAGAAAQNILLALHARGYASMWRTGAPAYDPEVKRALGLSPDDAIVAFLYAGTPLLPAPTIPRPSPSELVEEWREPASR